MPLPEECWIAIFHLYKDEPTSLYSIASLFGFRILEQVPPYVPLLFLGMRSTIFIVLFMHVT
jgi:hypothetical protein